MFLPPPSYQLYDLHRRQQEWNRDQARLEEGRKHSYQYLECESVEMSSDSDSEEEEVFQRALNKMKKVRKKIDFYPWEDDPLGLTSDEIARARVQDLWLLKHFPKKETKELFSDSSHPEADQLYFFYLFKNKKILDAEDFGPFNECQIRKIHSKIETASKQVKSAVTNTGSPDCPCNLL